MADSSSRNQLATAPCPECGRWNYHLAGCSRSALEARARVVEPPQLELQLGPLHPDDVARELARALEFSHAPVRAKRKGRRAMR